MSTKLGEVVNEEFTVIDDHYNLIRELVDGDFSKNIYDSNGNEVSDTISVVVSELGNGNYRALFTPNVVGDWYLVIHHPVYFPWGKGGSIKVKNNDVDSITDILVRIVGLEQENQYIDNTSYDDEDNLISCRIRLYDDSTKVGSSQNVIETYLATAGYTNNLLDYYKVVKQQ